MQLHFTGRNIEVTPAIKDYATDKFQKIARRDNSIQSVNIIFQLENITHIAEATLHVDGIEMHASAQANDLYAAIDALIDKLMGQITKHKEKSTDHR